MASNITQDIPLSTLYLQIEYADSPFATFGISNDSTEAEVRDAFHALALRIHPDKAPSDNLRELHTSLFQKVQAAYNELLEDHFGQSGEDSFAVPKRLPETLESLHARNVAFREALRSEREKALKFKHAADARRAAKQANLEVKNERLAEQREARSQMLEQEREKREKDTEKNREQTAQRLARTAEKNKEGPQALRMNSNLPPLDWETEADRLEREAESQKAIAAAIKKRNKPRRPLRDTPTAETARPMWEDSVDERLVCDAEIKGRWNKNLLSGGRSGSVSLSQKKQKAHNGAARMHKYNMALCEEADHMVKPALTGNRTFSALVEEEIVEAAFVGVETRAEARTDRVLYLMDGDVLEQYFLEDGVQAQRIALGLFATEES